MSVNNVNDFTQYSKGTNRVRNSIGANGASGIKFAQMLREKDGDLKFSAHARSRIKSRNIPMTNDIMSKLDKAVAGAEKKGSNETLVLLKDMAFIVNIPNKTIITAMEGKSIRDNIFTNIDSTVIAG
ncbi:MAG: TIGR02530 family flagellar biosynthesis protein [Chitinispirillia bacterium]|jgi:flagellar operon protein